MEKNVENQLYGTYEAHKEAMERIGEERTFIRAHKKK